MVAVLPTSGKFSCVVGTGTWPILLAETSYCQASSMTRWGDLGDPAIPYQHIRSKTRRACAVNHGATLNGIVHGAFPFSPLPMQGIALELGGGTNVQRLNNARIDCGNDVHSRV